MLPKLPPRHLQPQPTTLFVWSYLITHLGEGPTFSFNTKTQRHYCFASHLPFKRPSALTLILISALRITVLPTGNLPVPSSSWRPR